MDRLPADVHLAADRILDRRVVGIQLDQIIRAALGDQADVAVDGLGDVFGSRHGRQVTAPGLSGPHRHRPSADANSAALVTGRSQTRPRHT